MPRVLNYERDGFVKMTNWHEHYCAEEKARIVHIFGFCYRLPVEHNIDVLLDRAQEISKRKLGQDLGPFWLIGPDMPYDTPRSGWASVRAAITGEMRHVR